MGEAAEQTRELRLELAKCFESAKPFKPYLLTKQGVVVAGATASLSEELSKQLLRVGLVVGGFGQLDEET